MQAHLPLSMPPFWHCRPSWAACLAPVIAFVTWHIASAAKGVRSSLHAHLTGLHSSLHSGLSSAFTAQSEQDPPAATDCPRIGRTAEAAAAAWGRETQSGVTLPSSLAVLESLQTESLVSATAAVGLRQSQCKTFGSSRTGHAGVQPAATGWLAPPGQL